MRGTGVRGHENVEKSIVINIGVSRAPRDSWGSKSLAHLSRHFLKLSPANITKKMRGLRVAYALLDALDGVFDMAVGDENVGPSVIVVVKKETAEAECH